LGQHLHRGEEGPERPISQTYVLTLRLTGHG
jgi:hypothetical protein